MFRRVTIFLAAIFTFVAAEANTFKNGDFESGDTSGWIIWASMSNVKVTQGDAKSGNYAMVVGGGVEQDITLPKGRHTISAYVKMVKGDADYTTIQLRKMNKSYEFMVVEKMCIPPYPDYTPITFTIKLKQESKFRFGMIARNGVLFKVDNITIKSE